MKHLFSNRIFLITIAIAILARVVVAIFLGNHVEPQPGIFDQVSYHNLAIRVLQGHGFTFDQEWWPVTKAGEPTAHWSYLYTSYLVVVYKLFGVNPLAARVLQAVLAGALMPLLAYRIAKRVFAMTGEHAHAVGLAAAAAIALYGYLIYYAGALMTETFYITGLLWIFDASLRTGEKVRSAGGDPVPARNFLELGLAISFTALLRQVFLPFVPLLFLWLLLVFLKTKRFWPAAGALARGALLTLLVCIVLIAPITIHNYQKFQSFVLLNTNAGYAFFWANHPVHGNYFVPLFTPDMPTYQDLIPLELRHLNEAQLDKALMKLAVDEILRDPVRYLRLIASRIPAHFIFWPLPDSGLVSNATRVFSFGLALPFMLVGLAAWLRMERRQQNGKLLDVLRSDGMLLILFIAGYTAIHLMSWAGIRYRLPQDAPALIFAAYPLYLLAAQARSLRSPARRRSRASIQSSVKDANKPL